MTGDVLLLLATVQLSQRIRYLQSLWNATFFVVDHLGRKERESAMRKECSTLALGQLDALALFWP